MDPTQSGQYGLIWLSLALVNAGLAESKGRRRWTWFVLSLLFGPIATYLIVIWKRVDRSA